MQVWGGNCEARIEKAVEACNFVKVAPEFGSLVFLCMALASESFSISAALAGIWQATIRSPCRQPMYCCTGKTQGGISMASGYELAGCVGLVLPMALLGGAGMIVEGLALSHCHWPLHIADANANAIQGSDGVSVARGPGLGFEAINNSPSVYGIWYYTYVGSRGDGYQ